MREFKFRCWDKCFGMSYFNFSDLANRTITIDHGVYDVPVMQFIGLHDCNGEGIYEGDLVSSGEHTLYRVDWVESHAQYFFKVLKTENVLTKELRFPVWQYAVDGKCGVEIIGNIYENSELLEV